MEKAFRAKKGLTVGVGKDEDLSIEIDIGSANNPHIKYNTTTDKFEISEDGTTYVEVSKDENVKVSSADTTTGYLEDKIGGKTGEITLTKQDVGADESIEISLDSTLKTNYDNSYSHSITTTGNPHQVTKTDVGLGNVANTDTTDADNIADGLTNAIITLTQEANFETAYSKSHDQNTDTGTDSDDFSIGDGTDTDKTISVDNGDANSPQLKYNASTNKWQYSNDGTTFTDIGSGGSGSTDVVYLEVTQVAHGFDNDFIYNNGTDWIKAQADDRSTTATHFAVRVTDDIFNAVIIGEVDITGLTDDDSQALTNNTFYFLSQTVAGKLATIEPTTGIKQVVMKTNTTNNATISIEIPFDLAEPSNLAYTDVDNTFTAGQEINANSTTATLGDELVTNGTFTGSATGWTLGDGWSYGTDNIVLDNTAVTKGTVTQDITVEANSRYLISWVQTNSIAQNALITPSIGSVSGFKVAHCVDTTATTMEQVLEITTAGTVTFALTVTGNTNTGTVTIDTISIKKITEAGLPAKINGMEIRNINKSISMGEGAFGCSTSGTDNVAFGQFALYRNTSGIENIAIGRSAMSGNATGTGNVAIGRNALGASRIAGNNVAIGRAALRSTTNGITNTAVGAYALRDFELGDSNTGIGRNALAELTIGSGNVGIGEAVASFIGTASSVCSRANNSVFLGKDARPKANDETNQIVIGYAGRGNGSNTATIGNDNITNTYLKGSVAIGTTTPNANAILDLTSTTKAFIPPRMSTTQRNALTASSGMVIFNTSTSELQVYRGSFWEATGGSGSGISLTESQNFFGLLASRPATPYAGVTANGTTTIHTTTASSKSFFTFAFTNTDTVARVVNLLVDDVIIYSQELNAGETADLADIFAQPYLVADTTIKISSTVTTITYHINVIDVLDADLSGFFMHVGSCTGSEQTIRTSGASTKSKILGECYCNPTTATTYTISNKYNNVTYLSSKSIPAYNCVYLMNQGKTIPSSSTLKITGNNANVKYLIFGFEG